MKKRKIIKRLIAVFDYPWAGKWIPYSIGNHILNKFSKSSYAEKYLFKRKIRSFSAFLEDLEVEENQKDYSRQKFLVDYKKNWRCMSVSHMSSRQINKYFHLEGYDKFREYYNEGKGIILIGSHFGVAAVILSLFPKIGFEDLHTIVREDALESSKFKDINKDLQVNSLMFSKRSNAELMKSLFKAKNILDEGGLIHIMGDGQKGNATYTLRFINKLRSFRLSFTELGLATNAYLVPVFVIMDVRGHFHVKFSEPLDKGAESLSREDKTRHILVQYARILSDKWKEHPIQVNQGQIESYLRYVSFMGEEADGS